MLAIYDPHDKVRRGTIPLRGGLNGARGMGFRECHCVLGIGDTGSLRLPRSDCALRAALRRRWLRSAADAAAGPAGDAGGAPSDLDVLWLVTR
jgi:hypothetical protein